MFAIFNVRHPDSPLTCRRAASVAYTTREEAEEAMATLPPSRVPREVRQAEPTPEEAWGEYGPESYWEVA